MARRPSQGEALVAWGIWAALTVAVVVTYSRIDPAETYHVSREGLAGGVSRGVTLVNFPIALVAVLFGIVFTAVDFAVVYILTHGGPFNSTQVLPTWAYAVGIDSGSLGAGAAISLFLFPLLVLVTVAMLFFARRAQVS